MRIIGLDVCKDSVVAWVLESVPKNFRSYFRENKRPKDDPLKLYANQKGVTALLQLRPDCVVMEPTGIHYSWIWAHICAKENITVLWVGHQEAVHYRKQHKLPDKNDQADALALAAYALTHWGNDEFFLQFEAGAIALMRELWLQLQSLNRVKSPIINRARQQLAREFPITFSAKNNNLTVTTDPTLLPQIIQNTVKLLFSSFLEAALKRSEISLSDGLPPLLPLVSRKGAKSYSSQLLLRQIVQPQYRCCLRD